MEMEMADERGGDKDVRLWNVDGIRINHELQ